MPSSAAALADLFSKARLSLNLPSSSSTSRSVVFFDEVLNVEAVLTLPSDPLFPIASGSTAQGKHFSRPLPLPTLPTRTHPDHQSIPPYLNALLASLHVNLFTDYVPELSSSSTHVSKSTNPYEPLSTVQLRFEHLQLLPSHNPHADPAQPQHAAVRAFSNAWAGNQPPKPHRTLKDAADPQASNSPLASSSSSHRAHLTHDAHHWSVHWHCRVPINFIATPFQPLLSITAALTLRLDHALLEQFLPSSPSRAFVRSGFAHSLLAPLHEGPVYPDESPLQSQARATASSALGLDGPNGLGSYLAHLPKDVVGGNNTVVTPRSGAAALSAIQQRRNDALSTDAVAASSNSLSKPDSNGDLAAALSSRTASSSSNLAQSPSSQGATRSQSESEQHQAGLQIYKRSTRHVLPLKTGLNVRMRTLVTHHDPFLVHHGRLPTPELESTSLVLSVELENPFESDSSFAVNDIQIKINHPDSDQNDSSSAVAVVARPLQAMTSTLPIDLARGSQHNLLFYVSVETDMGQESVTRGGNTARNVTITVSGRPKAIREDEGMGESFDSQWNCALDLTPVLADAEKKRFIAGGPPAKGRMDRPMIAGGPVAGNGQYSASALRAAAQLEGYRQEGMRRGGDQVEDARTPRPGQLGMGFPPPLRTSSARNSSTTAWAAALPPCLPGAVQEEEGGGFLARAKARAANTRRYQSNVASLHDAPEVAKVVKPWMTSTNSSALPPAVAREGGGLVVLSTLRRVGHTALGSGDGEGAIRFESSLGQDGVMSSISTGAKVLLAPASIPTVVDGRDRIGMRIETGEVVMVELSLVNKSNVEGGNLGDVEISWVNFGSCFEQHRESIDKGRLMDADTARDKSSTTTQAGVVTGLIPIQDNVVLRGILGPGQSRKLSLGLRCLSPGYHNIPQLRLMRTEGEREQVMVLDGLGSVYVCPPTVGF
ncbi:uncharacterized protein UTRI_03115_B [Ustilago trichophora]|uniref:TRAPP trafficking subunit Trs65-domain-containing protein n=1 Tax=Ustilago trichophora TaxID=86804 RepID=A0A5C3E5U6_9BASI|nr:uncharacterized protein UTRI_03115_B [Ustilago trichophora]